MHTTPLTRRVLQSTGYFNFGGVQYTSIPLMAALVALITEVKL